MKKMTYKRIAAIAGIVLLAFLYLLTLIAAIGDFEGADRLFAASMAATVCVPILLWIYIWLYGKITGKDTIVTSKKEKKIDTVIFDIGNVLTNFRWREFFKDRGYSDETVEKIGKASVLGEDWGEYDRGVLPEEEIVERFVKKDSSVEKELRESLENVHGLVTRRDYAIPWIQELKAKGYRVLYLSNFSKKVDRECKEAMDFLSYADGGILSYKEHCVKPEPEIYQLLIKRYHLDPGTCVFLDDRPENLEAAEKFGMRTILFKTKEEAEKELKDLGVE